MFSMNEIPWGESRIIETKFGPRRARSWKIPTGSAFWDLWRTGYLKQQGYQVRKWHDEWEVTEWRELDGAELATAQADTRELQTLESEQAVIANIDPPLPRVMKARFASVESIYDQIEAETAEDYRYQLPSIKRLALALDAHGGALDASDTGVGKTSVACGVAKTLGLDLFVICPKSVIAPWRRMARLFDVTITVINYELLRTGNTEWASAEIETRNMRSGKERRERVFTWNEAEVDAERVLMVFDDCHKMKDYRTWNCLMGIEALGAGYKVLGASATAADNPMQMKFVALLTGLIWQPDQFFGWMSAHGVKQGKWGLQFVGGREVLADIHRAIFPARGSRIRIADLGDRFPETKIISEAYDMGKQATEEIQEVYDEMHREIAKLEATEAKDRSANILTQHLRAFQRSELLKVPTLVDMANDALDEGMSVALFFNYEDSLRAAARRLECRNTLTGQDKAEDRQRLIDEFNADEERLVILNIKISSGITLKRSSTSDGLTLALICPTYSAIDMKQALGRVHRAGGARSIQKIVYAAGTVEERACAKVRRKLRNIETINDGDLAV